MSGATGRESDKFMLRLPDGMRDKVKESAARNNRSMNEETVHALEEFLKPTPFKIETGPPVDPSTLGPADFRDGEPPIPISPEVRAAMEQVIVQIADDATRRLNEWLWINEVDKEDHK